MGGQEAQRSYSRYFVTATQRRSELLGPIRSCPLQIIPSLLRWQHEDREYNPLFTREAQCYAP
jgi:hypothetical protein